MPVGRTTTMQCLAKFGFCLALLLTPVAGGALEQRSPYRSAGWGSQYGWADFTSMPVQFEEEVCAVAHEWDMFMSVLAVAMSTLLAVICSIFSGSG